MQYSARMWRLCGLQAALNTKWGGFVSVMWIANGLMRLSAEMMLWFERMGVIFAVRVVCLSEKLVDWKMTGDEMNCLVMGSAHRNDRQKNNRESRFIFHGAQGRTRTDTPCGGGFWVPCVYQFRHLGSGFGLLKNGIIKHQYLVSTNFCKKIKKHAWASGVISKNSGLWWEENECVTMARGLKPNSGMWKDGNFVWLCGMTRRTHRHWIEKVLHGLRLQLV